MTATMPEEKKEWVVSPDEAGRRLDVFLSTVSELSRSAAARLIEEGRVLCDGRLPDKKDKVTAGSLINVCFPESREDKALPQDIPLDVIYEDDCLLVINKPSGMVVHAGAGNPDGTLVNALLFHCGDSLSGIGGVIRPGIVHRIDKDTSGLLVVAKNDEAHQKLAEQIAVHGVRRVYRAILVGNLRQDEGTVDAPIGRHPVDRKKMAVIRDAAHHARQAITHYRVLERFAGFCLVECRLETGRTHQIRVHMASLGHPVLGDPLYGGDKTAFEASHKGLLKGQALHAAELSFIHPKTGDVMRFTCPLPPEMERALELLRQGK